MSYWLGTMGGPQGGGVWLCMRTDDAWIVRSGRRDFSHTRRGESQFGARTNFTTLWPRSTIMGNPVDCLSQMGQDSACCGSSWSPWQRSIRGNGATKFIRGTCKDGSGVALGGAVVQGFLTATDAYVGETACDDHGNYELGTPYPSPAQHYLVAYKAGSPDLTGATVNTLTATNRDGTT